MASYEARTPQEYFQLIDDDWRKDRLLCLHDFILEVMPGWEATVHYKMLGYGPPNEPQMHMNAQKGFVGLYVGDVGLIDPEGTLLGGINCGKGCVRLRKKDVLDENLRAFLARYFELKRQGKTLGGR